MSRHVGTRRKDDAQNKIKAKVKTLKNYVKKKSIPKDTFIPKNEVEFRLWEDPELGLEKIGSPGTMNKPHNRALKKQAIELIKQLTQRKHRRQHQSTLIDSLRDKDREKTQLIKDLTSQYHVLKHECNRVQQDKRRLDNRVKELTDENASLTRQLRRVTGLRAIEGGA